MAIVVGTDFSVASISVTDAAAELARRRDEELILAHVADAPLLPSRLAQTQRVQRRIDDEADRLRAHGCSVRPTLLPKRDVGEALGALAESERATLLMMGAHSGALPSALGTSATSALRHVSCPVLVVRAPSRLWRAESSAAMRVLVPFALDVTDAGLAEALALISSTGGVDADFVHYRSVPETAADRMHPPLEREQELRAYFAALPPALHVRALIERDGYGRLDAHIGDLARERDVDVVVCGSHHRRGRDRRRQGSVAEGIVHRAPVSVLVARAPESGMRTDVGERVGFY